jgi:hypothetical protein
MCEVRIAPRVAGRDAGRAFGVEIHLRIRLAKGFGNRASYCLRIAAIKSVFLSDERRDRTLNGGRPCLDSSGNIAAPL